jgi:hypothetical protein
VTKIELSGQRLEGSISGVRFGNLAALHVLRLNDNRLAGDLPEGLGASCCPLLISLDVSFNSDIGGELCIELVRKEGASLDFFGSGRRIRTPFLVGVSLPSEVIPALFQFVAPLKAGSRTQPKVVTVKVHEQAGRSPDRTPEHRCIREGRGSQNTSASDWAHGGGGGATEQQGFTPWQKVWLEGLDALGEQAAERGEQETVYVVSHAHYPQYRGVFRRKFANADLSAEAQREKQFNDDFDPAYALEGIEAQSILDWERQAIEMMVRTHTGALVVQHIDELGQAHERPGWYGHKGAPEAADDRAWGTVVDEEGRAEQGREGGREVGAGNHAVLGVLAGEAAAI